MTIDEFVKSMAVAGFDFKFRAQGEGITIVGESIMCKDGKCVITKHRVMTADESRQAIKNILGKG